MPEILRYQPGSFCWAELATTNLESAKRFYSGLFGWSVNDIPMGDGTLYSMMQIAGKEVAALAELDSARRQQGILPHWFCYVSVESADRVASMVDDLGGGVVVQPFDVFDSGRMSVISDPAGALFGLWEPRGHIGARYGLEVNTMCWTELVTSDRNRSLDFYASLFGWSVKEDNGYTEYLLSDIPQAGMIHADKPVRPSWNVYFRVHDCDEIAERGEAMGGRIIIPPNDIPGVGRFSTLQDPHGAVFSVIRLD